LQPVFILGFALHQAGMGPTIARLHRFIAEAGCHPAGKHHGIYLSDIRRAAPAL
jgi:hypothetical protein